MGRTYGTVGVFQLVEEFLDYTKGYLDEDALAVIERCYKGGLSAERIEYYLSNEACKNYDIMWKVNEKFIDEQIAASKKIFLSNNPKKGYYFPDGARRFYQRELDYLTSQGYKFEKMSDELWQAIKK